MYRIVIGACGLFLSLLSLIWLGGCGSSKSTEPTAEAILSQMNEAYSHCSTYQDTGVVTTTFETSSGNWTDERPFSTAFVRPHHFRFEYEETVSSSGLRYIIWREGTEVLSWWDVRPGIETEDSLDMAIGGATGVSGGSAHKIPALLLPDEICGRKLTDITEAERIDDAEVDGISCYRIQGNYACDPMILWIEKGTFLVRRIETRHAFPDFSTVTVTTYDPIINGVVTDDMLAFNPPLQ